MTLSVAHRKAVSVLPLPVGARINVDSPRAIGGQLCARAAVERGTSLFSPSALSMVTYASSH
jgi:hypothetical protein